MKKKEAWQSENQILLDKVQKEYSQIAFNGEESAHTRLRALYLLEKHLKSRQERITTLIEIQK